MVRNLVTSLFENGRVVTSPAKAKEARPVAERLITMAKRGTLADRRRAIASLNDRHVVSQLFDEIGPRYAKRPGGYCRILHMERRRVGDNGALCLFELVEEEIKKKKGKAKAKKAAVKKTGSADADEQAPAAADAAENTEKEDASAVESSDRSESAEQDKPADDESAEKAEG